jgi:hypothetical protein
MTLIKKIIGIILLLITASFFIFITIQTHKKHTLDLGDNITFINAYDIVLWYNKNNKHHKPFDIIGSVIIKNPFELFYLKHHTSHDITNKIKNISGSLALTYTENPLFIIESFKNLESIGLRLDITNTYDVLPSEFYKELYHYNPGTGTVSNPVPGTLECLQHSGTMDSCPIDNFIEYTDPSTYEDLNDINIINGGTGYKKGDILKVTNNIDNSLIIEVTGVGDDDDVTNINIISKILATSYEIDTPYETEYLHQTYTGIVIDLDIRYEGGTGLQINISRVPSSIISQIKYILINKSFTSLTEIGKHRSTNDESVFFDLRYGQFVHCDHTDENFQIDYPDYYPSFSKPSNIDDGQCVALVDFKDENINYLTNNIIYLQPDIGGPQIRNGRLISKSSFTDTFKKHYKFPTIDFDVNSASVEVVSVDCLKTEFKPTCGEWQLDGANDKALILDQIYDTLVEDNYSFLYNIQIDGERPTIGGLFETYVFEDVDVTQWADYMYTSDEIAKVTVNIRKTNGNGDGAKAAIDFSESGNVYTISKFLIIDRGSGYDANSELTINITPPTPPDGGTGVEIDDPGLKVSIKIFEVTAIGLPSPFIDITKVSLKN